MVEKDVEMSPSGELNFKISQQSWTGNEAIQSSYFSGQPMYLKNQKIYLMFLNFIIWDLRYQVLKIWMMLNLMLQNLPNLYFKYSVSLLKNDGFGHSLCETISEKSKWKLATSLWLLSLVEWLIQVNISSIISQLWEKVFHQRQFLEFSHSLGTL